MNAITDWLGGLSGPVVYAVVAALVFAEDALFFGFVLPGETAVVIGGVLASQGKVEVWWLALAVVVAAIGGDSVGYEVGRHLGPRILGTRPLRRHVARAGRAKALIRRRGPVAVFFGRFFAFFRAMMPAPASVSRMPYRRFLLFNALGGLAWGVSFTLLGYFAGTAYTRIEGLVGRGVAVVLAVVVAAAAAVWHVRPAGSTPPQAVRTAARTTADRSGYAISPPPTAAARPPRSRRPAAEGSKCEPAAPARRDARAGTPPAPRPGLRRWRTAAPATTPIAAPGDRSPRTAVRPGRRRVAGEEEADHQQAGLREGHHKDTQRTEGRQRRGAVHRVDGDRCHGRMAGCSHRVIPRQASHGGGWDAPLFLQHVVAGSVCHRAPTTFSRRCRSWAARQRTSRWRRGVA
ncbi:DedA family protein [Streptomyces sp. NPDC102274]|uniref:DedA family protein n=1 Tax=Streptomyces sp. NPDC102274 TaxID=3366151 RepID=UPI003811E2C9